MQRNGIHHITAIAGNPRRNLDFYTAVLGLRLVKKTVNFDDPGTYHFYFGDEKGTPGTVLTFFPWDGMSSGRIGIGEVREVQFRVPEGSLGYWTHRFVEKGVVHERPARMFGETKIAFKDPDGLNLSLVGVASPHDEGVWQKGTVGIENAIRGFHAATLLVSDVVPTAAILRDVFGFSDVAQEDSRLRLSAKAGGDVGCLIDLQGAGDFLPGRMGAGTVHHIAFRAADDATQAAMVKTLMENHRIRTTEQKDRQYFRSVYFREPGGILFEIATDVPGFMIDEPADRLGETLKLPQFLEPMRGEIEATLPAVA